MNRDEPTRYQASAGWLEAAVSGLLAAGAQVVAPTETEPGVVNFAPVQAAAAICRQYGNVEIPLKRLFLPVTEILLEYERDGELQVRPQPLPSADEVVLMGARPCDVAALGVLDKVFQWDYADTRYLARRARTTIITFACATPDPTCFCTSVGCSPHDVRESDAIVFPGEGAEALLEVHTVKGRRFIERLGIAVRPAPAGTERPVPPDFRPKFDPEKVKGWLDANFENEFWAERALRCLGCGACSFLCPTCHCFDIVDEATWNRGQRRRNWDCCSFALFTQHASGHNPRPDQAARYRQRIMHKFKYFPERFGRIACVGCGRCIRTCRVGQDLAAALADIESR